MKIRQLLLVLPLAALCAGVLAAQEPGRSSVPLYDDLGDYTYPISSTNPLAQRYFDQGLRLYYAFNHAEAIRAFDEAARLDPDCAICVWGRAVSLGPNINAPMDSAAGAAAFVALQEATRRSAGASEKERALIEALTERYSANPTAPRAALDSAYARAMGEVAGQFPDDVDVAALYAEALMDLSPWNYWNKDGSPRSDTPVILAQLERILAADPTHPGANHFYIHAVEAVQPERALPMAERLAALMPGAGHIVHMPGHIYVRVGRYEDAIEANLHAVHADETYIQDQNPAFGTYTAGYYPHNYDFLAFAASLIGRRAQAMEAADEMTDVAPDEVAAMPGMTFIQLRGTRHLQMKVRFGDWDAILAEPSPAATLPFASAIWHYARGRAFAARGESAKADEELTALRALASSPGLEQATVEFNTAPAVLNIAAEALAGHIAASRKDYDSAVEHLREAARLEDALTYGEPPEWSIPVRQELGIVLLEAGRAGDAETVFREDLRKFPDNGWSLNGLARSLSAQQKTAEAAEVGRRFTEVWSSSDFTIRQ